MQRSPEPPARYLAAVELQQKIKAASRCTNIDMCSCVLMATDVKSHLRGRKAVEPVPDQICRAQSGLQLASASADRSEGSGSCSLLLQSPPRSGLCRARLVEHCSDRLLASPVFVRSVFLAWVVELTISSRGTLKAPDGLADRTQLLEHKAQRALSS